MELSSSLILGHNTPECPLCIVSFYIVPNTNINILPQDYILLFHSEAIHGLQGVTEK